MLLRTETKKPVPLVSKSLSDDALREVKKCIRLDKLNGNLCRELGTTYSLWLQYSLWLLSTFLFSDVSKHWFLKPLTENRLHGKCKIWYSSFSSYSIKKEENQILTTNYFIYVLPDRASCSSAVILLKSTWMLLKRFQLQVIIIKKNRFITKHELKIVLGKPKATTNQRRDFWPSVKIL